MKFSEIELPSNRKFGFFFTFVFAIASGYFAKYTDITWACIFAVASAIFLVVTVTNSDILLPLNKLWIRFGLLLGMILSPIVLGIIFFGVFTPIAIIMRLSGLDELRLKFSQKVSHWQTRGEPINAESFKQQF